MCRTNQKPAHTATLRLLVAVASPLYTTNVCTQQASDMSATIHTFRPSPEGKGREIHITIHDTIAYAESVPATPTSIIGLCFHMLIACMLLDLLCILCLRC